MLILSQERHIGYFDQKRKYVASFVLWGKGEDQNQSAPHIEVKYSCRLKVENHFTFTWLSKYYELKTTTPMDLHERADGCQGTLKQSSLNYPPMGFSLETYLLLLKDPSVWEFSLNQKADLILPQGQHEVGKLVIYTSFNNSLNYSHQKPIRPPVWFVTPNFTLGQTGLSTSIGSMKDLSHQSIHYRTKKFIFVQPKQSISTETGSKNEYESKVNLPTMIFSGDLVSTTEYEEVEDFTPQCPQGYVCYEYEVPKSVRNQHLMLLYLKGVCYEQVFGNQGKLTIKIISYLRKPQFIMNLSRLLSLLGDIIDLTGSLTLLQNIPVYNQMEDGYRIVFFSDLSSLYPRLFRSLLYDRIDDRWIIEGMVAYTRSNKHFQDCMTELIDKLMQGEEMFPLSNDTYCFDPVWKTKAAFLYHVLSNMKGTLDNSSESLARQILEFAKKYKLTSTNLFKRMKNNYGLDNNFRSVFEDQFVKMTGINRIFYELIDLKKANLLKIIIRQKSLANKMFKQYNWFRIKLERSFGIVSPLTERIIKKNRQEEGKKWELNGPLAVPQILRVVPYFVGKVAVQTDMSEPFDVELVEQNIIERERQSTTLKSRPTTKRGGGFGIQSAVGQSTEKAPETCTWMMIDTAHIFPAVYKNQNVREVVMLEKVKAQYNSEQEEIKVLNCISSRDHSGNERLGKALLEKVRRPDQHTATINVKRRILQIIPMFINKSQQATLWKDFLSLLKLYEPPCYDHSEDGHSFLMSLVESAGAITFRREFSYYFDQYHRILLAMLKFGSSRTEEKQERLRNQLLKSLLKWPSKYSYEVLAQINGWLEMGKAAPVSHLNMLKIIVENIIPQLNELQELTKGGKPLQNSKGVHSHEIFRRSRQLVTEAIKLDKSGILFSIQLYYELKYQQHICVSGLEFLKHCFSRLEEIEQCRPEAYAACLNKLKFVLQGNQKKWGLQLQLQLSQDQGYFLAEYLWGRLVEEQTLRRAQIRLEWMKIYRIFYFYYTPVGTIVKIKQNIKEGVSDFPQLQVSDLEEILAGLSDFVPDIRWFSLYDSINSKEQKEKYERENNEYYRRRRRYEEFKLSGDNFLTRWLKQNHGKETWEDCSKKALGTILELYESKQLNETNPSQLRTYKEIIEGVKNLQNNLKRNNKPENYSYEKLKEQAMEVFMRYPKKLSIQVESIFTIVEGVLEEIDRQRQQREDERKNEFKINLGDLSEVEEEEEGARAANSDHHESHAQQDQNKMEQDGQQEGIAENGIADRFGTSQFSSPQRPRSSQGLTKDGKQRHRSSSGHLNEDHEEGNSGSKKYNGDLFSFYQEHADKDQMDNYMGE